MTLKKAAKPDASMTDKEKEQAGTDAAIYIRGASSEMAAIEQLGDGKTGKPLVPGFKFKSRHASVPGAVLDCAIVSVDPPEVTRFMETKGAIVDTWTQVLDGFESGGKAESMVTRMVNQLRAARKAAPDVKPVLAVIEKLETTAAPGQNSHLERLRAMLASKSIDVDVDIVLLHEDRITTASRRLRAGLGFGGVNP